MSDTVVRPTAALEKVMSGDELTFNDGVDLLKNENLFLLGNAANQLRKEIRGDNVSFVSSYYLNYTNVCAASCQLCAFYRKEKDDDAYTLSNEQIIKRAEFALNDLGATELHIVGGFNPRLGMEYYEDMFKSIKTRFPKVIIKALTPAEIFFISKVTKNSIKEVLERLKNAGLDALPGGGAEIFSKQTRDKIVLGKCSGDEWLNTVYEAHRIGLKGNCTMLFGHIETPEDIVDHIIKLRELNKKTGGFTTFIPLKFSLENTQLEREHTLTSESPSTYDLRIIAISRLLLGKALKNVSVYWIALGKKLAQVALCYGGNDLVGTAFSEEIFKAAGKPNQISIQELKFLICEIKRNPVQRDTFFNPI
ncbi:radical SAM protein [Candidatus Nitrosocosmicus arcticus]|uniref:FO synthase subunit 2 (7,8-didemethyl-8-hydroxy-5-deazariboflavin synthase) 2 n=1 Tax=Candidatus Nitrosocosmicus arcticus TaxID=2035267 RepID=A0A557SYR1_9ARCH|nr:radical SAM protein [Candidatus Nitrosocosmicus arcticus]TVP41745.1 FO synthase subunit 2 (7,8-didemethyl-8-hydroxy-5-deazariboflavin synthase) 2 [Candidatus Nitrosocosmicus arcticus]